MGWQWSVLPLASGSRNWDAGDGDGVGLFVFVCLFRVYVYVGLCCCCCLCGWKGYLGMVREEMVEVLLVWCCWDSARYGRYGIGMGVREVGEEDGRNEGKGRKRG